MKIQERDILLFEALFRYQFLTTGMIKELIFNDSNKSVTYRRLKKLILNNFLGNLLLKNRYGLLEEKVFYLKEKSYEYLGEVYKKKSHPKKMLGHTIEIIRTQIHFEKALNFHNHFFIRDFKNEREFTINENGQRFRAIYDRFFLQRTQEQITVTPDIAIVFEVKESSDTFLIFLEIDKGTENSFQIRQKLKKYYEYLHNSGKKFKKKFNVTSNNFRIYFLTTSTKRINHLLTTFKLEYGLELFRFATYEDFYKTKDLTEKIWFKNTGENVSLFKSRK